jgi:predicted RNase H-like HicB family nuclease
MPIFPVGRRSPVKYKVALHHTAEGISIEALGLPGCWSQGATEAEALANIQHAIREYLAARNALVRDDEIREVEVV